MMKLKLDEILVGKKMEPRYLEYNWRDVVLYALAVGAKRDDLMYTYEKYLKAIPTYGTVPYWGTVNVRPYQWMPLPASMLANDIIKPTISFLNMDHEIIMHRPIDPIKGTFQYQDVITDVYDRGEGKGAVVRTRIDVRDEAGNGMHVHMLLLKNGEPVFYDEKGYAQLSDEALWFIGGLLAHAGAICGITNPSTNSFRRLVPGFEAPVTIGYAMANRSAVVRIPAYAKSPKAKRFELRNPDATCNPYYAYAAILMAGLDGIANKIDPHAMGWGPFDFNLFDLSDEEKAKIKGLPKSLEEALDALESDHEFLTRGGVFPERLIKIWIQRRRKEAEAIARIPHPAEFQKYYDL